MSVNAREEEYEHIQLFGHQALFTNSHINRETVPKGWFCYDLRGSDYDPGKPIMVEEKVTVNHAGSILIPTEIQMRKDNRRRIRSMDLNFIGEIMGVETFCEELGIPCPYEETKFEIKPSSEENGDLFFAAKPEVDKRNGCIGHVRIDFGRSGKEFWHTWWPRGPEELNSASFKEELTEVVNALRKNVLKSFSDMKRYCEQNGGKIKGGWKDNYGYELQTERYRYCLRCNPVQGDYNAYLVCYDLHAQQLIGRLSFANGEKIEYTDPQKFLNAIREELPYHSTTGMEHEVLTEEPTIRKEVDDEIYNFYGEENPRALESYQETCGEEALQELEGTKLTM